MAARSVRLALSLAYHRWSPNTRRTPRRNGSQATSTRPGFIELTTETTAYRTMHLQSSRIPTLSSTLLLLPLFLLFLQLTTAAPNPYTRKPSSVTYCNEPNFKGKCITSKNINSENGWGTCRFLSATTPEDGPRGSLAVSPNGKCTLFAADHCNWENLPRDKWLTLSFDLIGGNKSQTSINDVTKGSFRHFLCVDTI